MPAVTGARGPALAFNGRHRGPEASPSLRSILAFEGALRRVVPPLARPKRQLGPGGVVPPLPAFSS